MVDHVPVDLRGNALMVCYNNNARDVLILQRGAKTCQLRDRCTEGVLLSKGHAGCSDTGMHEGAGHK